MYFSQTLPLTEDVRQNISPETSGSFRISLSDNEFIIICTRESVLVGVFILSCPLSRLLIFSRLADDDIASSYLSLSHPLPRFFGLQGNSSPSTIDKQKARIRRQLTAPEKIHFLDGRRGRFLLCAKMKQTVYLRISAVYFYRRNIHSMHDQQPHTNAYTYTYTQHVHTIPLPIITTTITLLYCYYYYYNQLLVDSSDAKQRPKLLCNDFY